MRKGGIFRQLDLSKSPYGQERGFVMRELAVAPGHKEPENTEAVYHISEWKQAFFLH